MTPAAEMLQEKYPLAATMLLRSMIGFALDNGRSSRYRHAARIWRSAHRSHLISTISAASGLTTSMSPS